MARGGGDQRSLPHPRRASQGGLHPDQLERAKVRSISQVFFVLFLNIDSICFNLFSSFLKNTQKFKSRINFFIKFRCQIWIGIQKSVYNILTFWSSLNFPKQHACGKLTGLQELSEIFAANV